MNADARARLRDIALLFLIGLYCIGVLLADLSLWPGRTPTILLALPVLVAALKKSPQFVISAAIIATIANVLDTVLEHPPLTPAGVSFLALVAICFLATFISLQRQQAAERERQRQAIIHAVEQLRQPLTVITGYVQMLCTRPDLPTAVMVYLGKIETSAKRLKHQVDQLLSES